MKSPLLSVLLSTALVSGGAAFAQAPSGIGPIDHRALAGVTQSTAGASTTLRARGTIDTYDASNRVLSLSTSGGKLMLPVPPASRIRQGGQTVEAADLAKLSGYRATVRYSESGGHKVVESIHVFGK